LRKLRDQFCAERSERDGMRDVLRDADATGCAEPGSRRIRHRVSL
jgi:hypothetical protein